jgi:transcriptional regulator with XRE-family HTH domain
MMPTETFGDRLRLERTRLGLTQEAFSAVGGVKKLAQGAYEQDKRFPDASYLIAIAKVGVDIQYVLLGIPSTNNLTDDENELLVGYRKMDIRGRARVLGVVDGINEPLAAVPGGRIQNIAIHGKVEHKVTGGINGPTTINRGGKKK